MTDVKRAYDASGRQAQARARRRAVVGAARELFERDGFRATTIAGVAAAAGVSPETVYKAFGTKAALAKAVFDVTVAGDDEPVAVAERPAAMAIRDEPDVRRKVAMFVGGLVQRLERSARVQILIRDGRHVDESLEPVWADPAPGGSDRDGACSARTCSRPASCATASTLDEVRDLLWNYLAVDHYERLVLEQGWTPARYESWLAGAITGTLLADPART